MAKQYKNVYTILEKVKKGEIKSYYSDRDGLFGKINFYKKPDLIKPHMHYLDESRIEKIMEQYLSDGKNYEDAIRRIQGSAEFNKLSKKPDGAQLIQDTKEIYKKKFPKNMVRDIFKMYYHRMERLSFEERTDKNYSQFKFLEKANNPVSKIMSEGSNLKSAIFARNILGYYAMRLAMLKYLDPDSADKIMKSMGGEQGDDSSEFDNADIDSALDSMMNSQQSKNMMEKALEQAADLCKEMDKHMDGDIQEKMFEQVSESGGNEASKLSPDYIKTVARQLNKVKMTMGSVKEKIKKLLDKSVSYFSAKDKTHFEDILNADDIAGLQDYELLHPKLRKIMIEDILIKEVKKMGKIDIYIDVSGSMSSGCGARAADGSNVSKIDFSKSFALKLEEMGMLNDVYLFNNSVKKYRKDPVSISMIDANGGTTINNAVRTIERNGVNALVITDAEDSCSEYSDKAFFIGVEGARFSHFSPSVIKKYSESGQVIIFDGSSIRKVDRDGNEIS